MPLFSLPVSLRKWGTLGASGRSGRRSPCEPGHRRPHISDGPVVVAIPFELCLPPASGQGGHRIVFGGRSEGEALAPVLEDLFLRVVEDKPCLASVKWAGPLQDPVCWVFSLCNPGQHFAVSFENCYWLHCCHTQHVVLILVIFSSGQVPDHGLLFPGDHGIFDCWCQWLAYTWSNASPEMPRFLRI